MRFLPLLWATLWRRKSRTILTMLSLVTAFLLLGLLQAANSLLGLGTVNLNAPILITQARVSFTSPLPMRLLPQIEAVPGVDAVSFSQFFGGIYKDPKNFFPQFATMPDRWFRVFTECKLGPGQLEAWKASRTAAVAGKNLVERYGWKIGDRIPLTSQIWPQKDGSRAWAFDLVGIVDDATTDSCPRKNNMYIRYDYLDEARQFGQGLAGIFVVRLKDQSQAERISSQIDAMFENSPDETKTQTERDFTLNFARQVGNLNLILNLILCAVFFTILLLTGNTMSQAVRERIPELAVMKTIGFTDTGVLVLVLAEALLICFIGGMAGMLLSVGVMKVFAKVLTQFPAVRADLRVWTIALVTMPTLGLIVGGFPAWRAKRLSIVDALAGR
ncbi:MAG TPA: ABC transporter permease [Nevskiaceae bacterium]|nr:ABC transporter permease [Nevskiaceae bacterium]